MLLATLAARADSGCCCPHYHFIFHTCTNAPNGQGNCSPFSYPDSDYVIDRHWCQDWEPGNVDCPNGSQIQCNNTVGYYQCTLPPPACPGCGGSAPIGGGATQPDMFCGNAAQLSQLENEQRDLRAQFIATWEASFSTSESDALALSEENILVAPCEGGAYLPFRSNTYLRPKLS